jgi:hypothetical protein
MLDQPLRHDLRHDLIGVVRPLATGVPQREGQRSGEVVGIGGCELIVGHARPYRESRNKSRTCTRLAIRDIVRGSGKRDSSWATIPSNHLEKKPPAPATKVAKLATHLLDSLDGLFGYGAEVMDDAPHNHDAQTTQNFNPGDPAARL